MMAARSFKSLFGGAGRNALDLPVAGLAALAAAFAAFAVPQDLLSRAVVATGLPSLLSAAQPPLGLTARVVLAVGGAAIAFGLVFLLLRLLDRSGMSASVSPRQDEDDVLTPRVRRRDVHPDAPARRPISAARDLGEPAPPEAPRAAVPVRLDEAAPVAAGGFGPELAAAAAFAPEPVAEIQPAPEPASLETPEIVVEPDQFPEAAPEGAAMLGPEAAPEPESETGQTPQAELPTSIAALLERLEEGLAKRRMPAMARPVAAAPPQVFPEAAEAPDDRLQSAIASLQRLAARTS